MESREVNIDIESMGGEERILSILLSTSDLAKLDLSNLQLFQANANNGLHINSEPDSFSFIRETGGPGVLPEPVVFKSRAVMEAEASNSMPHQQPKKAASMEEMEVDRLASETGSKAAHEDCTVGGGPSRGCRARRPAPISGITRKNNHAALPLPEPQQVAKPRIDLKSSPASKFLVQLMPWELQPSPVTPFTPAAIPFKWEEAPGRPKPPAPDRRSPRPALHLPPRLLLQPAASAKRTPLQLPKEVLRGRHWPQSGSSGSAEEKTVLSIEGASEKLRDDDQKRAGWLVDCELRSPWNGNITPAYSPLRDLGPSDLCWRAKAYALITMWRKNSSSKHNKNKSSLNSSNRNYKPMPLNPSGELLIQEEDHEVWVNEEADTETRAKSASAMIVAAMGAKTEDFDFSKTMPHSKKKRPNPQFLGSKMPRSTRTKRKWVLRKLRRPAKLSKSFFSAVWRAVFLRKSRHRSIGNTKHSYQSLGH